MKKGLFVSSTFKDFQKERDIIQKNIIPYINFELANYGIDFFATDLRWGINDIGDADKGLKILRSCLGKIDDSKPYMIILLGNRYGWEPNIELINQICAEKNIELENKNISVTELEIEYGTQLYKALPSDHVIICIRNSSDVDDEKTFRLKRRIEKIYKDRIIYYSTEKEFENSLKAELKNKLLKDAEEIKQLSVSEKHDFYAKKFLEQYLLYEPTDQKEKDLLLFYKTYGKFNPQQLDDYLFFGISNLYFPLTLVSYQEDDEIWNRIIIRSEINLLTKKYPEDRVFIYLPTDNPELSISFKDFIYESLCKTLNVSIKEKPNYNDIVQLAFKLEEKDFDVHFFTLKYSDDVLRTLYSIQKATPKRIINNINVEYFKNTLFHFIPDNHYTRMPEAENKCPFSVVDNFAFSTGHLYGQTYTNPKTIVNLLAKKYAKELPDETINLLVKKFEYKPFLYCSLLFQRLLNLNKKDFKIIASRGGGADEIYKFINNKIKKAPNNLSDLLDQIFSELVKTIPGAMILLSLFSYNKHIPLDFLREIIKKYTLFWTNVSENDLAILLFSYNDIFIYDPFTDSYYIENEDSLSFLYQLYEFSRKQIDYYVENEYSKIDKKFAKYFLS